jgi:hypothetical protein
MSEVVYLGRGRHEKHKQQFFCYIDLLCEGWVEGFPFWWNNMTQMHPKIALLQRLSGEILINVF